MKLVAKSLAAVLAVCLFGGFGLGGGVTAPAAADPSPAEHPASSPVYEGPSALFDPLDPFQSLRWTLGMTIPTRDRVGRGRGELIPRVEYDLNRNLVLLSYQAGREEILPPMSFSPQSYLHFAFSRELRQAWIEANRRVLTETQTQKEKGLVNLRLPFEIPFTEKIFGKGAPNLRVSGREQITFSGTSSWVVDQVKGERGGGSMFPKLDMRQQLNVNLQGTIGSKLSVSVAQNSEALTPLENSIKIRYKGEEDEVVKSVEMGNTNLNLPSTQFVSFSTRQEGLFGIKAQGEVGGIGVTAIASRQEGESGQATLTGGAKEQVQTIEDSQFLQGKYFFISDPDSAPVPVLVPGQLRVYMDDRDFRNDVELGAQDAEAWIDPTQKTPKDKPYRGQFHLLHEEEDYTVYNNENFAQPILILRNGLSPDQVLAVAYRQVLSPGDTLDVGTFSKKAEGDTLQLKMIRPNKETWGSQKLSESIWAPTRRLELRNVYSLNARNIDPKSFTLQVVRDIGGNNPSDLVRDDGRRTPYIQVLGLDQRNNEDASDYSPDGKIDPEFVDYTQGLLFFPDLRPFDPSIADIEGTKYRQRSWPIPSNLSRPDILGWVMEGGVPVRAPEEIRQNETVPEVYDLRPDVLSTNASEHHLYSLVATFRTAVNTIQLNALGQILEGSETVRLNGEVLKRGQDYTIFYDTGTINLKNPAATAPGADLVVTYSYDSPFSRGSRSLIGASLGTTNSPNSKYAFSTSWLHESLGVPDRRPRLGQEPTKTTVGDISGQLRLTPWALTEWVDRIPLVSTTTPSRLDLSGALGLSFPNPNTRDVVYIDDMEGAELITSAGINRYNWFYSSAPARARHYGEDGTFDDITPYPTDRGKLLWFSPNTVRVGNITPGADVRDERNDIVPVLEVIYIPQDNPQGPNGSWGGLVSTLSPTGVDISEYQYIDVWLNDYVNVQGGIDDAGRPKVRRGELFIDVGTVSEDAVWDPATPPAAPNDSLDFEDRNFSGGQVEAAEDIGLDNTPNRNESPPPGERFTSVSESVDPAGDDRRKTIETGLPEQTLSQRLNKYLGINGTEGNQQPDTEDLNGDMRLQKRNDYLEYHINLADSAFTDLGRDYPAQFSTPGNGWRLYRIPLNEFQDKIGNPDLSTVRHMRIWFRGVDPGDTLDLQIASINIVGNRWEVSNDVNLCPDQLFNVAVVNNKENGEYKPPFGVRRVNSIEEREQSISLEFENLHTDGDVRAYKPLLDARDYTLYQQIAFYVSPRLESLAPDDSLEFYLRFGSDASTDTLSYYEVSTVLSKDDPRLQKRGDGWLDFRFDLTDLSRLKIGAPNGTRQDSFLVGGPFYPGSCEDDEEGGGGDGGGAPPGIGRPKLRQYSAEGGFAPGYPARAKIGDGLEVTVRGTPSFSRVRRISVGLRNLSGRKLPRGRVWFNELRMGAVRRETGFAGRASVNLVLADLASLQGSLSMTSADFLRLGQTKGSGNKDVNYSLGTQVNLNKFVEKLGFQAPLQISLKRSRRTPKFRPNSDIEFNGKDTGRDITETGQRDVSLSVARTGRGNSPLLLRYTLDPIRVSGNMGRSYNIGVTQVDTTEHRNGSISYNFNAGTFSPLRLLHRLDVWPWPKTLQATLTRGTNEHRVWSRDDRDPTHLIQSNGSKTRSGVLQLGASLQPIRILTYSWSSSRDLIASHFGPDSSIVRRQMPSRKFFGWDIGRETRQSQNLSANYVPPFGTGFRPRISWSTSYTRNSDPNLTRADYDSTVIDVNNSNNVNLSLTVPLGRMTEKIFGGKRETGTSPRSAAHPMGRGQNMQHPGFKRAEKDSTQSEEKTKTGHAGGNGLRTLFTRLIRFSDVHGSATFGKRSSISGIHGSVPLGYQLGLSRDVGLGKSVFPVYRAPFNQNSGENQTYRGNTKVTLANRLALDFNFQKRLDRSRTNNGLGRVGDDTTWPEIRFNWGDIHKHLPLINKIFTDFKAVSSSYSRNTKKSGTEINPSETVTEGTAWRPLVSIKGTLRGNWRTSFSAEKSSTQTTSQREGSASSSNERSNVTYRLTLSKRFSRKTGKKSRDIDVNVDASYNKQTSVTRSSAGIVPAQVQENDNLQIKTSATLRFSRTMSGTFGLNFGQQRNVTSKYTRRSIGISFSTGFNF